MLKTNIKRISVVVLLLSVSIFCNGDEYKSFVDKMPQIKGGIDKIYSELKYPESALDDDIQGKVYVMTFINEKGSVDKTVVIKGVGGDCDQAVMDAIKKCDFTPGSQKGKPVKVKMPILINITPAFYTK